MLKKLFTAFSLSLTCVAAMASTADTISYVPHVHGTVRTRFEASTEHGDYRFQVRNARVSLDGKIAPIADYFIQADFCDRGKMKILDVWARVWATRSVGFQAGQFRMPFGVDPFRAPHTYYFANRSFIGNMMCNVRAVGFKVMWHPENMPFKLEAGAFNPNTISDHSTWNKKLSYALKLTAAIKNLELATGIQSLSPDSVRMNLVGLAATWRWGRWIVEGEYMYKHYTHLRHKSAHAYNIFANYRMPLKSRFFNRLSFQGRLDGMTPHSSGTRNPECLLVTNHPARNRITVGSTISYVRTKNMFLDLRLNYEKFFYHSGYAPDSDEGDKIVAELVFRF